MQDAGEAGNLIESVDVALLAAFALWTALVQSVDVQPVGQIMGPNPLKLCEELLRGVNIAKGSRVCDLGSGTGITSVMLAREYGLDVYAVDLWSDPDENRTFFREMSVPDERIHPVKANAAEGLSFEPEFFDGVVGIDSYNYFGRDPNYLGERLLPYVKSGGRIYLSIPGMVRDCHDALPLRRVRSSSWIPSRSRL